MEIKARSSLLRESGGTFLRNSENNRREPWLTKYEIFDFYLTFTYQILGKLTQFVFENSSLLKEKGNVL